jgi:hypothetical protein
MREGKTEGWKMFPFFRKDGEKTCANGLAVTYPPTPQPFPVLYHPSVETALFPFARDPQENMAASILISFPIL